MSSPPPPRGEHKSERRDIIDVEAAAEAEAQMDGAAAAAAAAAPPGSVAAPPTVQSRVGRRVQKPQLFAPSFTPQPTGKGAAAASSSAAASGSVARSKKQATKRGGKSQKKGGKNNVEVEDEPAGSGYNGEGYTVTDHSWWGGQVDILYASPVLEDLETNYVKISCEDACAQANIELVRSLRVELESDTIEALKAAISGPHERGEKNAKVLALCESGETVRCALFQSEPGNSDSIRVVSTCFIKSGEPLGVYMGTIREAHNFEQMYGSRPEQNASSYEITASNLPASYVGPSLILETTTHGNEARFIRDARWDDLEISPNVQCRVCWNHAKGLPYLALIALADIDAGCELFVEWGSEAWSAHARARLHKYSSLSWKRHQRMKDLQRALAQRGIEPYASRQIVPITAGIPFEEWHRATDTGQPPASVAATAALLGAAPAASSSSAAAAASSSSLSAHSRILMEESEDAAPAAAAAAAAGGAPFGASVRVSIVGDEVRYMDAIGRLPARSPRVEALLAGEAEPAPMDMGSSSSSAAAAASSAAAAVPTAADAAAAVAAATVAASQLPLKRRAATSREMPAPSPRGHMPTFILRNTRQVFENCGNKKLMASCDYSELSAQTLADLKAVGVAPRLTRSQSEALAEILRTGRCPKAAVYEVVSLRHPARFYCSPDYPAYALIARQRIDAREPIGVYIGKVHTHDKFHGDSKPEDKIKQVYAYDMIKELFPKDYKGEALVCESLSIGGNETRYVNDVWCRRGGGEAKNAEATLMFHFDAALGQYVPVMVICASRVIHKGEEIITDYGSDFWSKISTALVREHEIFMASSQAQLQETERLLREEIRKEQAKKMRVDPESIPLDSIELHFGPPASNGTAAGSRAAAAAASSSSSAAAAAASSSSASPSSRWDPYRALFNHHDVLYSHCSPPVLLDPERHADPFAAEQFTMAAAVQQAAIAREQERQQRAAKLAERAAIRKAQAEEELEKRRQLRETAAANGHKPRLSARQQKKADADESNMILDSDAEREDEAHKQEAIRLVERKIAKAAARSPTKQRAASKPAAAAAAAASSSVPMLLSDDDDVQLLSSPPAPSPHRASSSSGPRLPRPKAYVELSRSSLAPPFQCDECGSPCHPRDHLDITYIKCRVHFKAALREGRQAQADKDTAANAAAAAKGALHSSFAAAAAAAASAVLSSTLGVVRSVVSLVESPSPPPAASAAAAPSSASASLSAAAAAAASSSSSLHKRKSPSVGEHKSYSRNAQPALPPSAAADAANSSKRARFDADDDERKQSSEDTMD